MTIWLDGAGEACVMAALFAGKGGAYRGSRKARGFDVDDHLTVDTSTTRMLHDSPTLPVE